MSKGTRPRVTIGIPCYNAERTIVETLESVLSQDYPAFEIVVCDNASTDRTPPIVKSYESKGVKYIHNSIVRSAEANWNHLLDHIATEYLCLYHADDLYDPSMVSRQMDFLLNEQVSAVFTMSSIINENNAILKPRKKTESALPSSLKGERTFGFKVIFNAILIHSNFIRTPTLMTTKKTLEAVGKFRYDLFKSSSDLDLWLRMSRYKAIGIIDETLHRYRISNAQGSSLIYNSRLEPQDYFKVIDHYLREKSVKDLVSERALASYQSHEGEELVTCSTNLLLHGEPQRAIQFLRVALNWKNVWYAKRFLRRLVKYAIGFGLLISAYLGFGKALAGAVDSAYRKERKIWSKT